MPIYEYKCDKCTKVFEVLQKSNKQAEKCPKCGRPAKKMVSSRVGLMFKGSGFYETDYKSKKDVSGTNSVIKEAKEKKPDKAQKADKPVKTEKPSKKETTGGIRK